MLDSVAIMAADLVQGLAPMVDVSPLAPPGSEKITPVVGYVAWGVVIVCVIVFLVSAGKLATAALTGREIEGAKGLMLAIIGCVLVGSASAILAVFTSV